MTANPHLAALLAACTFSAYGLAQNSDPAAAALSGQLEFASVPGWVKLKEPALVPASSFVPAYAALSGLGQDDEVQLVRTENDGLGLVHHRYRQMHAGVPVEGAELLVHTKEGYVRSANGRLVTGLALSATPSLGTEQARTQALAHVKGETYMWQDEGAEAMLRRIRNDPSATYFPKPELVFMDNTFSGRAENYRLAYRVDVYSAEPLIRQDVYIDAHTGEVLVSLNKIHTGNSNGVAETMYSGVQNIITDSVAPDQFRLREVRGGVAIETYNMQNGLFYGTAVDFNDSDNYWNNVNPKKDQAAPDGHWGTEMTYDYFINYHGRNSFDGNGAPMICYMHYRDGYQNAFWNGEFMTYGDGAGNSKPFVAIDVCGHEFAHGLTQFSAGLVYRYESGALNESFSDIFGYMVEWLGDSATANWTMAEDLGTFRDMSDPKRFSHPDTYLGVNWHTTPDDQGGVHTNSGVQNHWFYLLTDGDSGTNDNGDYYNVQGIGRHKAADIAYRNLTVYLSKWSQYADARQGAIWAAEDLYGVCSPEVMQTAGAWYAVGVGDTLSDNDLRLSALETSPSSCGLTASEPVTVKLRLDGCNTLQAGDSIPLAYRVDSGAVVRDTLVLAAPLTAGAIVSHTFSVPADYSATGKHYVDAWVELPGDMVAGNDSLLALEVENKAVQNSDFAMVDIVSPVSGCELTASEPVTVRLRFEGCDSLAAGTKVPVAYRLNGGSPAADTVVLAATVYQGDTVTHTFQAPASLSGGTSFTFDTWTDYLPDTMTTNDSVLSHQVGRPVSIAEDYITFEDAAGVTDSFYVYTGSRARAYVSDTSVSTGAYAFQLTGSRFMDIRTQFGYKRPHDLNAWKVNDDYLSRICFCVDATAWATANVTFELRQTYNGIYGAQVGGAFPYTSNLRLTVNGVQVGGQYNPATKKDDKFDFHHVNLDAFSGTAFDLCFEAKNYEGREAEKYPSLYSGDNAFIDNINITEVVNVGVQEGEDNKSVVVYPNPGDGSFTVSFETGVAERAAVSVSDVTGRPVASEEWHVGVAGAVRSIDLRGKASPGIYLLRITFGSEIFTRRLIVR